MKTISSVHLAFVVFSRAGLAKSTAHRMALSLLSAVVRSLDSTEKTKRMCAVLRLVTDRTCLAAFRVYWKCLKLKCMRVCQRKANAIVQEQFLINDHIFVVSQGPPDHCELKSTRIAVSVSQRLFPSHILPFRSSYAAVSVFADTQLACVSLPRLWWSLWRSTSYFKARVCLHTHLWLPVPDMFEKYVSTWFRGL